MTTLRLPRHALDSRNLAGHIAHHLKLPISYDVDIKGGVLVVDLFDTPIEEAQDAARFWLDPHHIEFEVTA